MKGLSWGEGALKKHKSDWQERSYSKVLFLQPAESTQRLLVGSQLAEGQGAQSSAAPIYKPGEAQSDSDGSSNDSGQRQQIKKPQPRWIEETAEVKAKLAWRRADLKTQAKQKR